MRRTAEMSPQPNAPTIDPTALDHASDLRLAQELDPIALHNFSLAAGHIAFSETLNGMLGSKIEKSVKNQRANPHEPSLLEQPWVRQAWGHRLSIASTAKGPLLPVLAELPATLQVASVIKDRVARNEDVTTEDLIGHADALRRAAPLASAVSTLAGSRLKPKARAGIALLSTFGPAARVIGPARRRMDTKVASTVAELVNDHRPEIIQGFETARAQTVGPLSQLFDRILKMSEHPQEQIRREAGLLTYNIWRGVNTQPGHEVTSAEVGRSIYNFIRTLQHPGYQDWVKDNLPLLSELGIDKMPPIPESVHIKGITIKTETLLAVGAVDIMRGLELAAAPGHKLSMDMEFRLDDMRKHPVALHRTIRNAPFLRGEVARLGFLPDLVQSARDLVPRDRAHADAIIAALEDLLTIRSKR